MYRFYIDCIELEYTFKSWLVENGVDDVQMIIDIKSGNDDGWFVNIKCVLLFRVN